MLMRFMTNLQKINLPHGAACIPGAPPDCFASI
jgi:hypothetical protein